MKFVVYAARTVAVFLIGLLALPFAWQLITGDYFMAVTGKSMEPTYHIGDVLVVQKPTGGELNRVGQIVVVAFTPGDKKTQYVHRVHAIRPEGTILRGDNNAVDDPSVVTDKQLMGTPRAVLSGMLGSAYVLSQQLIVRIAVAVIAIAAFFAPTRRRSGSSGAADVAAADRTDDTTSAVSRTRKHVAA